jgi:hypothetical protein
LGLEVGVELMSSECRVKHLSLSVSNICIKVCENSVEVSISPSWDSLGRHEYIAVGTVDEVLNELNKLVEDIQRASKAIEDMVMEVGREDDDKQVHGHG